MCIFQHNSARKIDNLGGEGNMEKEHHEKSELLEELKRLKIENKKLQAERAKQAREYFNYKEVINNLSDAIYYFKIHENGLSGNFLEVNTCAYTRLGYTRAEMLNMSPLDIDFSTKEDVLKLYEIISANKQFSFESKHIRKDRTQLPVEVMAHKIEINGETFIMAVCKDISERKASEKLLNSTKEQYEKLVESSTNGIAVVQDARFVFVNKTLVKMLDAKKKEQIIGKRLSDLLDSPSQNVCKALMHQGKSHHKISCVWTSIKNRRIEAEVITIPTDFQDKPSNQLIIADLKERKQTEQLMLQAEKMNVVGQLAAGIAHEIRNPLTSLKGFVQLFRSGSMPNDMFLNIMENELERIDAISNEFLLLAKPYNLDFAPVDIKKVIVDVVRLLDTMAFSQSISIINQFKTSEAIVSGVSSELKQVFINLIKNAIESMPGGGEIIIRIEKKNAFVDVSIKDEGVGMTKDQLKKLGEPFYTTKERGTGLGLMVTHKIIHNHQGKIYVESHLNKGTLLTVRLPAYSLSSQHDSTS